MIEYLPEKHAWTDGNNFVSGESVEESIEWELKWSNILERSVYKPKVFFMGRRLTAGMVREKVAEKLLSNII